MSQSQQYNPNLYETPYRPNQISRGANNEYSQQPKSNNQQYLQRQAQQGYNPLQQVYGQQQQVLMQQQSSGNEPNYRPASNGQQRGGPMELQGQGQAQRQGGQGNFHYSGSNDKIDKYRENNQQQINSMSSAPTNFSKGVLPQSQQDDKRQEKEKEQRLQYQSELSKQIQETKERKEREKKLAYEQDLKEEMKIQKYLEDKKKQESQKKNERGHGKHRGDRERNQLKDNNQENVAEMEMSYHSHKEKYSPNNSQYQHMKMNETRQLSVGATNQQLGNMSGMRSGNIPNQSEYYAQGSMNMSNYGQQGMQGMEEVRDNNQIQLYDPNRNPDYYNQGDMESFQKFLSQRLNNVAQPTSIQSQIHMLKTDITRHRQELSDYISNLKLEAQEAAQLKVEAERELARIREEIKRKKNMEMIYDHQFAEVLEKHAPYNNTHIPYSDVNYGYIVANRNRSSNPNNQFRSSSTMIYNKEELVNENLPSRNYDNNNLNNHASYNQNFSSLAKVGKSLVGDTRFIPIEGRVIDSQSISVDKGNNEQGSYFQEERSRIMSPPNNNINKMSTNFVNVNRGANQGNGDGGVEMSTDELYSKLNEITNMNNRNRERNAGAGVHGGNPSSNANTFGNAYGNSYGIQDRMSKHSSRNNLGEMNDIGIGSNSRFDMENDNFNMEESDNGIRASGDHRSKEATKTERKEIDKLLDDFIQNN